MGIEILPAIDLRAGRCVRLIQGDPGRETVYAEDPVAQARHWAEQGAARIHVVDLDGAFSGAQHHLEVIRRILDGVSIPIQVGGGIRDQTAAHDLLEAGVSRVVIGTAAVERPELLASLCGLYPGRIMLGVDTRAGRVSLDGWTREGELTGLELIDRVGDLALAGLIYTDISRDGMMAGPNLEAMQAVLAVSPFPVIASGGIACEADVRRLAELGVSGMIIGKALYTGDLALPSLLQLV